MDGLDRGFLHGCPHAREVAIGACVRGRDEPARTERPEREVEQTLGDDRVRARHLRRGGGLEPAVLAQVDADGANVE